MDKSSKRNSSAVDSVPLLHLHESSFTRSAFQDAYDDHQAIHIRGYKPSKQLDDDADFFHADNVMSLFNSLNDQDKESWCIENKEANHKGDDDNKDTNASNFLCNNKEGRGYCSFLVQHSNEVLGDLLKSRLPMVHLPVKESDTDDESNANLLKVEYGPALWLFFGKNYNSDDALLGRPEHTDSVTHDGTFHYQLSGTKIWRLRPTNELMQKYKKQNQSSPSNKKRKVEEGDSDKEDKTQHIEVECKEGDILLLNTRLWWHSTIIPSQDVPCISYARDIYFNIQKDESVPEQLPNQESAMTNVDGTYAAEAIEADTVLFTERNMPNIELPRCKENPNCQVVELEDEAGDPYMAVVSLRDIKSGEFFTLMESDDEEEEENLFVDSDDEEFCMNAR